MTFAVGQSAVKSRMFAGQRAAPAVDRLVVVADDGQVARGAGQQRDEAVLHGVRVLELVDEDVPAALRQRVEHLGEVAEEPQRQHEQVVEVDGVVGLSADS